jgi:hypothetical protein
VCVCVCVCVCVLAVVFVLESARASLSETVGGGGRRSVMLVREYARAREKKYCQQTSFSHVSYPMQRHTQGERESARARAREREKARASERESARVRV